MKVGFKFLVQDLGVRETAPEFRFQSRETRSKQVSKRVGDV